ncbi:hypothetical protein ES703_110655 [subsurface metagenome]
MCFEGSFNPRFLHSHFRCSPHDISALKGMIFKGMKHGMKFFEGWVPYDIQEHENEYLITIPLPGLTKDAVKVSIVGRNLNITAKRSKSDENKGVSDESKKSYGVYGAPFFMDFFALMSKKDINLDIPLQIDADENMVKSKMANGLLEIKIGKKLAKSIDINTEGND